MFDDNFASGLSIDFFAKKEFESVESLSGLSWDRANARNIIRLLMLEQVIGWRKTFNLKTIKFALYEATRFEQDLMIEALQEGLCHICTQLNKKDLNEKQLRQADILIATILGYIPFAYPNNGTKFLVPCLINNHWKMVAYSINLIDLTNEKKNICLIFTNNDRVWAYGLAPRNNNNANPWLLFQGTTYPSGPGFITEVMADMRPFRTVGHDLFVSGKAEIEKWFQKHRNKKMNVTGVSLGASLSLLTACSFGDKCRQVIAINPAGLVENFALEKIDHWHEFEDKPDVQVIKQGADPVSTFGTWKSDWTILRGVVNKNRPNLLTHHFVNFACSEDIRFIKESVNHDKGYRRCNNLILYTSGRALIYTIILLPWRYVMVPLYRLARVILCASYSLIPSLLNLMALAASRCVRAVTILTTMVVAVLNNLVFNINYRYLNGFSKTEIGDEGIKFNEVRDMRL